MKEHPPNEVSVFGTEGSLSLLSLRQWEGSQMVRSEDNYGATVSKTVGRFTDGEKWRQLRRKNGAEMAESKSGKLILYSVSDRKPMQFTEKRGQMMWSHLDFLKTSSAAWFRICWRRKTRNSIKETFEKHKSPKTGSTLWKKKKKKKRPKNGVGKYILQRTSSFKHPTLVI